jgi:aryl-alcohol dehydrogenase (NADP+)
MEYVNLGNSGLKVSRICLGMMSYGTPEWRDYTLTEEESRPIIKRAIELGINFFDTADMYSLGLSEEVTGRALSDYARRDDVVLATKTYWPMSDDVNDRGLSRKHIMQAVDNSLRRLGTDYVDLFYIHRWDYEVPIEETMEALHDVVRAGKALYIGASSMFAWQFSKAQYTARMNGWTPFVAMQNHMNVAYREEEREMVPLCIDQGVGVVPWSPLARGFLVGNRTRDKEGPTTRAKSDALAQEYYFQPRDFDVLERVIQLADGHGVTPAQIALAWLLNKPGITGPVVGASKMYHLEEAVAAVEIKLSEEEMAFLEEPYQPHPILGHE